MNWIPVDEALIAEGLNPLEAAALQEARGVADASSDPVPGICSGLAARIRAVVLAGGRTRLQGGPCTVSLDAGGADSSQGVVTRDRAKLLIPAALRPEATAILRYKLLLRFALNVTEDRRLEAQEAEKRLDDIARGDFPLLDEEQTDASIPAPTYEARPRRWSPSPTGGVMPPSGGFSPRGAY